MAERAPPFPRGAHRLDGRRRYLARPRRCDRWDVLAGDRRNRGDLRRRIGYGQFRLSWCGRVGHGRWLRRHVRGRRAGRQRQSERLNGTLVVQWVAHCRILSILCPVRGPGFAARWLAPTTQLVDARSFMPHPRRGARHSRGTSLVAGWMTGMSRWHAVWAATGSDCVTCRSGRRTALGLDRPGRTQGGRRRILHFRQRWSDRARGCRAPCTRSR